MRRGAETGASVSHHSESCQQTHHYTLKKVMNHGGLNAQVPVFRADSIHAFGMGCIKVAVITDVTCVASTISFSRSLSGILPIILVILGDSPRSYAGSL